MCQPYGWLESLAILVVIRHAFNSERGMHTLEDTVHVLQYL
jgi:hypothetical protein